MRRFAKTALILPALALGACYHVTVDTGRAPNGQTIREPFALGFIYGIVPPKTVETASRCPNGVSKVESQLSFVNGLVNIITFGIVTPMQIDVACAGPGGASSGASAAKTLKVGANSSTADVQAVFGKAAEISKETGAPVYVQF
jgi:hypothetical protein